MRTRKRVEELEKRIKQLENCLRESFEVFDKAIKDLFEITAKKEDKA